MLNKDNFVCKSCNKKDNCIYIKSNEIDQCSKYQNRMYDPIIECNNDSEV